MSIIDRLVGAVSPQRALHREAARRALDILNTGYSETGAARGKQWSQGLNDRGGSAREDVEVNLSILRRRSRLLYMGGGLGRAAIRRMRTNVVGTGLMLRAAPDWEALGLTKGQGQAWARAVEREWRLWSSSKDCDRTGLDTFEELQAVALMAWLMSGDAFVVLQEGRRAGQPYDLRLNLIEADQVCTPGGISVNGAYATQWAGGAQGSPEIRDGVELGPGGEVAAYHVARAHPLSSSWNGERKWDRIPVRGPQSGRRLILHLMERERIGCYRGVPFLAGVIEDLQQISRYKSAELLAAVVSAFFTVFIRSDTPDSPLGESFGIGNQATAGDPEADRKLEMGAGSIIGLEPGQSIETANPQRPNVQFEGFVNAVASLVGAALDIPFEVLTLRFNSSYSASRAALLQAWTFFRIWRQMMATDLCQPVYEEWLTEAVLKGRISAPGFLDDPGIRAAWCRSAWHGPTPGQVDPVKEVQAAKLRVEECFSTREREAAELTGSDWDETVEQRGVEERQRRDAELTAERRSSV